MTTEHSPDMDDSEQEPSAPPPKILGLLGDSFEPARMDPPPVSGIPGTKPARATAWALKEQTARRLDIFLKQAAEARSYALAQWSKKQVRMAVGFGVAGMLILALLIGAASSGRKATRRRARAARIAEVGALQPAADAALDSTIGLQPRFGLPTPPSPAEVEAKLVSSALPAAQRPLRIAKATLCRNVTGFARYEPLTEMRLRARHLPLVQLYLEFEGARPDLRDDGRHIYRLAQDIRMVRSDSEQSAPLIDTTVSLTEVAMGPKRDFFASQYLRPLHTAAPGNYLIEVRLTDQIAETTVSAKVPVIIVAE